MYFFIYFGECKVGAEGGKHLTKSNWPMMKQMKIGNSLFINLGDNLIFYDAYQNMS